MLNGLAKEKTLIVKFAALTMNGVNCTKPGILIPGMREGGRMPDEIRKMIPPGGTRAHMFCSLERDGLELWVDLTDARKKKGHDSAHLYRLEDGVLVFDRYIRVSLLRKEGVC